MKSFQKKSLSPEQVEAENNRFRAEQQQYDLRYRCEDCLHFSAQEDRCSLGFLKSHFGDGPHRCLTETGALVFCKYFELQ